MTVKSQVIVSDVCALGSLLWVPYSSVHAVAVLAIKIVQKRNTEAGFSASEKIKNGV